MPDKRLPGVNGIAKRQKKEPALAGSRAKSLGKQTFLALQGLEGYWYGCFRQDIESS